MSRTQHNIYFTIVVRHPWNKTEGVANSSSATPSPSEVYLGFYKDNRHGSVRMRASPLRRQKPDLLLTHHFSTVLSLDSTLDCLRGCSMHGINYIYCVKTPSERLKDEVFVLFKCNTSLYPQLDRDTVKAIIKHCSSSNANLYNWPTNVKML